MNTVYKYPLREAIGNVNAIGMPEGAKIIHVGLDPNGACCLWAEVNTLRFLVQRKFVIVGTGHSLDDPIFDPSKHVGSLVDAPFVWHIYEIA